MRKDFNYLRDLVLPLLNSGGVLLLVGKTSTKNFPSQFQVRRISLNICSKNITSDISNLDHKHLWLKKITKYFDISILFICLSMFRACYTHYQGSTFKIFYILHY